MTSTPALLAQAIQSLADPNNPIFCCRYYICLLSHIEIENALIWENPIIRDAPYASDNLRLKLSALAESMSLLDALSAFITTNRSREDMAALAHRMEHCECDRTDRLIDGMHAWKWNSTAYCRNPPGFVCRVCTLEGLIAIVADLFFNALQLHDHRQTRWPRNRRQCLVGNDETAATMLCRWLDFYPILPLLRAISAAASSFGRLVLVPFLLSAHLPKNLVAILKRGVDSLPADFAGDFNPFGVVYPITLVFITIKELRTSMTVYPLRIFTANITPYQLAMNIMLTLAELPPQCMDISCTEATAASMCSGCRRVAYYNAQCQAHDWSGPLPHKKVCKTIRALGDAAGFPVYANPKSPPQVEVDVRRRFQDTVSLSAANAFNKNMIEDDRIRKVVNDKYSARYQRSLD
ncbi:hypothetical protein DFH09DRAFT_1158529 [Mycena vulgaris]|nr:hypothetical protein DFH09DRAFT_1158529 [Mycena vulgaris]